MTRWEQLVTRTDPDQLEELSLAMSEIQNGATAKMRTLVWEWIAGVNNGLNLTPGDLRNSMLANGFGPPDDPDDNE